MAVKKALVLSGGGAKGAYTAGVVYHLLKRESLSFDIAIGTSTGSLAGGPALLENPRYLRNQYVCLENKDVLKNSFLGKVVSLIAKTKVPIQAKMDPLHDLLHKYYITDGKLAELIETGRVLVVTSVDVHTGEVEYVSSADVENGQISKETFVKGILASASEPVFTKPTKIYESEQHHPKQNHLFFDGGVREFLPLEHAVGLEASEIWAISTHRLDFNKTDWGDTSSGKKATILRALKWTIDAALNEVERGDLFRAYAFSRVERAADQIRLLATSANLDEITQSKLQKIMDNLFPSIKEVLKDLYVITPTRTLTASLEFDPKVMNRYFVWGRNDAKELFSRPGGPPKFRDESGFLTG